MKNHPIEVWLIIAVWAVPTVIGLATFIQKLTQGA